MSNKVVDNFLREILTEEEYKEVGHLPEVQTMYTEEFINSVNVVKINNKRFLILKKDTERLPSDWIRTLALLTQKENDSLMNPVHVTIDEDGILLVD